MTGVWGDVYESPPLRRRAIFAAAAVFLHTPLLMWRMFPVGARPTEMTLARRIEFLDRVVRATKKEAPVPEAKRSLTVREEKLLADRAATLRQLSERSVESAQRLQSVPGGGGERGLTPLSSVLVPVNPGNVLDSRSETAKILPVPAPVGAGTGAGTPSLTHLPKDLRSVGVSGSKSEAALVVGPGLRAPGTPPSKGTGGGGTGLVAGGGAVPLAPKYRRTEPGEGGGFGFGRGSGLGRGSGTMGGDGASCVISGQLAERKVLKRVNPEYPEWARALDVGGAVVLSFTVSPDGRVMNDIQVENSTVEALNPVAVEALRRWRFAPLDPGDTEIQKGNIIMMFSLR